MCVICRKLFTCERPTLAKSGGILNCCPLHVYVCVDTGAFKKGFDENVVWINSDGTRTDKLSNYTRRQADGRSHEQGRIHFHKSPMSKRHGRAD